MDLRIVAVGLSFLLVAGFANAQTEACEKAQCLSAILASAPTPTGPYESEQVERAIVQLAKLGQPAVCELRQLLKHPMAHVRVRGCEVILWLKPPTVRQSADELIDALVPLLNDSDPVIRQQAAARTRRVNFLANRRSE